MRLLAKICPQCGEKFSGMPSKIGHQIYCSRSCAAKNVDMSGPKNPGWKNGSSYLNKLGARFLGKRFGEIMHHKDGNHFNNELSNLQIVTAKEHAQIHAQIRREQK